MRKPWQAAADGAVSIPAATLMLFGELSRRLRWQLVPVLLLMLVGALAELVTLGALLPFLAVIADPEGSAILAEARPLLAGLGIETPTRLLHALTGLFAAAALLAGALRLTILWASQKYVYGIAYELSVGIYANILAQPYVYHTRHNSSDVIAATSKVQMLVGQFLLPLVTALAATLLACFIVTGLVLIDPDVALVSGIAFASIYLLASLLTRHKLRRNSGVIAQAQDARVRVMQEGLGGIRDILIDRSQPVFVATFEQAESALRDAQARNTLFANAPRFVIESIGMVLIALVAVVVVGRPGGIAGAIPVLGGLALGAQRLLPLLQQIYLGWAMVMGSRQSLIDILRLLQESAPPATPATAALPFTQAIVLDNLGYAYAQGHAPALHGVSLAIPKGARVGIAGRTGSGKSTLMDLVIGLLQPSEGEIRIDGVPLTDANRFAWQRNIAHVPQAIYLADATIAENIAFGVRRGEIDHGRVRRAAEQAELGEVIEALPRGYDTRIGERGIRLSGGQRQRVGIARALYKQASVLVLDEATSALDSETEASVMAAIGRLDRDLTILMIAHRLSTLESCDLIVRLEAGRTASLQTVAEPAVGA